MSAIADINVTINLQKRSGIVTTGQKEKTAAKTVGSIDSPEQGLKWENEIPRDQQHPKHVWMPRDQGLSGFDGIAALLKNDTAALELNLYRLTKSIEGFVSNAFIRRID